MPIYTYRCQKCSAEFEEEMDRDSKRTPPCPECSSKITKKIVTSHPIHYRGKGFTKSIINKE